MTSPPVTPPPPFPWGVASSAFQIEGAAATDGKGPSIWDTFCQTPGKVAGNHTGDVACDFYHRYEADIALMARLGVSAFRFSLAWARILPAGRGDPNPAGLAFYHRVLDALAAAGIEPHVSLYHWDLPQALEDEYEGWLSPTSVDDFAAYADLAFREFGGKVKFWSTFNEPYTFAFCGYAHGIHAPGRCSDRAKCAGGGDSAVEPWLVSHHVLLAHAAAVAAFRARSIPGGRISINLNAEWAEPATASPADAAAASRYLDFQVGLYAEPVFLTGDYPASVRARVPALPAFTPAQSAALKGSADYFALNHYTSRWVRDVAPGDPAGAPADAEALTELDGKVRQAREERRGGVGGWGLERERNLLARSTRPLFSLPSFFFPLPAHRPPRRLLLAVRRALGLPQAAAPRARHLRRAGGRPGRVGDRVRVRWAGRGDHPAPRRPGRHLPHRLLQGLRGGGGGGGGGGRAHQGLLCLVPAG